MRRLIYLALFCLAVVLAVWGAKKIWLKVFPELQTNLPLFLLLDDGSQIITDQYLSPFNWRSREKDIDFRWGVNKAAPAEINYLVLLHPDSWQAYLTSRDKDPQELLYSSSQWSFWRPGRTPAEAEPMPLDKIIALAPSEAKLEQARQNPQVQERLAKAAASPTSAKAGPDL